MGAIVLPINHRDVTGGPARKPGKGFDAHATLEDARVTLRMEGAADAEVQASMGPILRTIHEHAVRARAKEVVVDIRNLEFMNSSCFKTFVTWLAALDASEDPDIGVGAMGFVPFDPVDRYTIRFIADPQKHWQKRSLEALMCFATDLVRIES